MLSGCCDLLLQAVVIQLESRSRTTDAVVARQPNRQSPERRWNAAATFSQPSPSLEPALRPHQVLWQFVPSHRGPPANEDRHPIKSGPMIQAALPEGHV